MMTIGMAAEWMMRNPGRRVVDSDGDRWWYDGEQSFMLQTQRRPAESCNLFLPMMLEHTFEIEDQLETEGKAER